MPTLSDQAVVLPSFMNQQEAREVKLREEANCQEDQFKALQHQFRPLQQEVEVRTSPVPEPASTVPDPSKDYDLTENHPKAELIHPTMPLAGQLYF